MERNSYSTIFGKGTEERIVAIEPKDHLTEIFIQELDGSISSKWVKNEYWILAHNQLGSDWIRLKGENHYKWGRKYKERDSFLKARGYLRNKDIFSIYDPKEAFLVKFGHSYFKGMKHTDPSVLSFDIETTGLYKNSDSKVILISNTYRGPQGIEKKLFCYDEYPDDGAMIKAWCAWVREKNPTVLTGHNIVTYDLPYLDHVANMYGVELVLGRDGSKLWFNSYESKFRKDQTQHILYYKPNCYGRNIIDTLFLAIKADIAAKKYESYGLKYLAQAEGFQKPNREFYDASKIRFNYKDPEEMVKIKNYCVDDSDEALGLYDLFIAPFFYSCQTIPKSFQTITETASGSQINSLLLRAYLQEGKSIPKANETFHFEGAISFGIPGIYRNSIRFDATSLYPSIMIKYNVFSEQKDPENCLIETLKYFKEERIKNKKLAKETGNMYYKHLETTQKILANSYYGFLSAEGLNFNFPSGAAEVTRLGREIISKVIKWASGNEASSYIQD